MEGKVGNLRTKKYRNYSGNRILSGPGAQVPREIENSKCGLNVSISSCLDKTDINLFRYPILVVSLLLVFVGVCGV